MKQKHRRALVVVQTKGLSTPEAVSRSGQNLTAVVSQVGQVAENSVSLK